MSPNSKDAPDNQKNIANVVGKHADRVMDGLFSEIEDLLSGDLQEKSPPAGSLSATAPMAARSTAPQNPTPGSIYQQQPLVQPDTGIAAPAPAPAKTGGGLWKKILAGTGILVLLSGGGLWWLQKQGKIDLSSIAALGGSNSDTQFSDYLRRSFTKIEGNSTAPTVPSAESQLAIPNPPADSAVPAPTAAAAATVNASFLKIVPGTPPVAEFSINGQPQQLKSGDAIGTSGWTVGSIAASGDNEVIVKRNGEIRSLKTGDKL